MRSALAWLARLALGVVLLALAVLAMLLVTAHTGWGREQLRKRVEAALKETFPGGARVGAIEGSLVGTLTVRNVELRRTDGAPLVAIAAVRIDLALWPLAVRTARVHRLVAEDVRVVVRAQADEPVREEPPSPWRIEIAHAVVERAVVEAELGGSRVTLGEIAATGAAIVERGEVRLFAWSHGRWRERDAAVTAMGSVVVDDGVRVPSALISIGGATPDATAGLTPGAMPGTMVGASGVALDGDRPRGRLWAITSGRALAALLPERGLSVEAADPLGDIVVAADAMPAVATDAAPDTAPDTAVDATSTRVELFARTGAGNLWASLRGEPARRAARGVVSADVDLAAATRGRWCGRARAVAALDGGPDRLRGTVILHGDLLGAMHRLDRWRGAPAAACTVADAPPGAQDAVLAIEATRDPVRSTPAGRVDQVKALVLAGGDDALAAFAVASGHLRDGAIVLDDARGAARSHAVAAGGRRITGRLAVEASAAGTLAPTLDVRVEGAASGTAIAVDDLAVAAAQGSFALDATARGALGRARVMATGVRNGKTEIGTVDAELANRADGTVRVAATARPAPGVEIFADARVAARDARIIADLDHSRATLPGGTIWAGRGGSIAVSDEAIALRGVTLRRGERGSGGARGSSGDAGGASIALRGDLARATGALTARASAEGMPASLLDPRLRGLASGTLELARRRGAWKADGRFDLRGFAVAAAASDPAPRDPAVDATAHLVLVDRRLTLDARASGPAVGAAELALEVTAPRDPFDGLAWQALPPHAIHRAMITARRVELSGLAALIGARGGAQLRGTIDGAINLAPAGLGGALAVHGIELPFAAIDGDVRVTARDGDLGVDATARLGDVASGRLATRFAVPDRPFHPATWQRRGRDWLREAAVELDEVAFTPELLGRLGIARALGGLRLDAPYRGRASVALVLGAAATQGRLAIDLHDVTGGALVAPVSQHIAISAGPGGTTVHAALHAQGLSLGEIHGDVAMTPERWIDDPRAVLGEPISARWTLPVTRAEAVLAILGRPDLASGTLEGTAEISGTLAAPLATARFTVRDIAVAAPPGGRPPAVLRALDLDASWDGGTGSVAITGHEASGGELRVRARGRPDALAAATAELTARRFEIAPVAVLLSSAVPSLPRALVSAAGALDGALARSPGGKIVGSLDITGGTLPIGAAIGTLRDASARLTVDDRALTATLRGKLGRGTVDVTANAPADLSTIAATAQLRQVSPVLALRPVIDARLTAALRVAGRCTGHEAAWLCGSITIANARVVLPEQPSTPLLDDSAPDDLHVARGAPGAHNLPAGSPGSRPPRLPWLVANVTLGPARLEARDAFEGIGFRAHLHGEDLHVALGDTVAVRGIVEIDSADADVLGRRYAVEPSDVEFEGTADPKLKIRMAHQFPELTLNVMVGGSVSKPEPRFHSEPGGYTHDQLFGFFFGGEPGGDPSSQAGEALTGAGARYVSSRLGRQISKVLPFRLDAVSCEPAITASTVTGGSCTFGTWLSERWYLAYRPRLGAATEESAGDIQVQFRMSRKVLLEGAGDRDRFGADVLWRHRW